MIVLSMLAAPRSPLRPVSVPLHDSEGEGEDEGDSDSAVAKGRALLYVGVERVA